MDTASTQPGELTLPLPSSASATELSFRPEAASVAAVQKPATQAPASLPPTLLDDLYATAEAAPLPLTPEELAQALTTIGTRHNHNQPPGTHPTPAQQQAFYKSLRLPELALAQAGALGREPAWQRFLALYRAPLTQAAIAITGSATLGHDLADNLYAELFGLSTKEGERRSPLATYSGRGSLLGWLRSTLAQRHVDHHRRTHRETPLETQLTEPEALPTSITPLPTELNNLTQALTRTLETLQPEDRFLLAAYFLDRQTLLQIARLLHVHEATISRKLKRLTTDLRKQLLRNLQSTGLSKRAAEEALGADPRDLEINLRALLQTSQSPPFKDQPAHPGAP